MWSNGQLTPLIYMTSISEGQICMKEEGKIVIIQALDDDDDEKIFNDNIGQSGVGEEG